MQPQDTTLEKGHKNFTIFILQQYHKIMKKSNTVECFLAKNILMQKNRRFDADTNLLQCCNSVQIKSFSPFTDIHLILSITYLYIFLANIEATFSKKRRFLCFALDFTSISASVNIVKFLRIADKKFMVKKLLFYILDVPTEC